LIGTNLAPCLLAIQPTLYAGFGGWIFCSSAVTNISTPLWKAIHKQAEKSRPHCSILLLGLSDFSSPKKNLQDVGVRRRAAVPAPAAELSGGVALGLCL